MSRMEASFPFLAAVVCSPKPQLFVVGPWRSGDSIPRPFKSATYPVSSNKAVMSLPVDPFSLWLGSNKVDSNGGDKNDGRLSQKVRTYKLRIQSSYSQSVLRRLL